MKKKDILLIGALGVGAYFLFKNKTQTQGGTSAESVEGASFSLPNPLGYLNQVPAFSLGQEVFSAQTDLVKTLLSTSKQLMDPVFNVVENIIPKAKDNTSGSSLPLSSFVNTGLVGTLGATGTIQTPQSVFSTTPAIPAPSWANTSGVALLTNANVAPTTGNIITNLISGATNVMNTPTPQTVNVISSKPTPSKIAGIPDESTKTATNPYGVVYF